MPTKVLPKRNIAKSLTWRLIGALDLFAVSWFFTGDPTSGLKMGVADTLTKLVFYYIHERIWVHIDLRKHSTFQQSRKRHISKAITWRLFSTLWTIVLGWVLLGDLWSGTKISLVESVIQLVLYYFHERVWHRSRYGIVEEDE